MGVLQAHVERGSVGGIETTLVNYQSLRESPSELRGYLRQLCNVSLDSLSKAEAAALYCNAYNALMIAIVVHFAPADSVRQLDSLMPSGSIFREPLGTVGRLKVSLDDMEHSYVRGALAKDLGVQGRIHSCFVCASLSCPDIQMVPFEAASFVEQLTTATRAWLANPTKNPGPDSGGKLILSKIFFWYGPDFIAAEGSRQSFVQKYSSWQVPNDQQIAFIDYNWALNAVNGTGSYSGAATGGPSLLLAAVLALIVACTRM